MFTSSRAAADRFLLPVSFRRGHWASRWRSRGARGTCFQDALTALALLGSLPTRSAGLALRELLTGRWQTVSTILLICVPLVDLVLLAATIIDLRGGTVADTSHGLAAYIGFSIAFGHSLVRWADAHFAHRFAGGPRPETPPRDGWVRARHQRREWGKAVLAWSISCLLLLGGIALVGEAERIQALQAWIWQLTMVLAIWLIWPV